MTNLQSVPRFPAIWLPLAMNNESNDELLVIVTAILNGLFAHRKNHTRKHERFMAFLWNLTTKKLKELHCLLWKLNVQVTQQNEAEMAEPKT
jgi:hypothetical protein